MHSPLPDSPGTEYSFGDFRLEADGSLRRGEELVHLPPKELAALQLLLAQAGQIVSPLQLRQALWGDVHVTADSVPKCLSTLRSHLEPLECIQTIYKRGYRFTAEVTRFEMAVANALPRLAILPFATEYGVPGHLGEAVAEWSIARLAAAHYPAATVLAQDSAFMLARRGLPARTIGERLEADLVVTGVLRALPTHYRLWAEMIRVPDGAQLWVEDMLVDRSRIAGLEEELVHRLHGRLGGTGWRHMAAAPEAQGEICARRREAWELFERGHAEWQTLQRQRMQDGFRHLLRASELDPELTEARVDLVNLSVTQATYGYIPATAAAEVARRAAQGVRARAPGATSLLPGLGWFCFHVDRNLPEALRLFARSAELPHNQWVTRARSMFALSRHRFAEAAEILRAAIRLDPFSPWLQARLAWTLHLAGEAAESVRQVNMALDGFPEHEGANLYGAMILAFNGQVERAVELARELVQRLPSFDLAAGAYAYALACAGQRDQAAMTLERLQWVSRERFVQRSFTPAAYVALGNPQAALEELREAEASRCPWFFQTLADPRLKPLAATREFAAMRQLLAVLEAEAADTALE